MHADSCTLSNCYDRSKWLKETDPLRYGGKNGRWSTGGASKGAKIDMGTNSK